MQQMPAAPAAAQPPRHSPAPARTQHELKNSRPRLGPEAHPRNQHHATRDHKNPTLGGFGGSAGLTSKASSSMNRENPAEFAGSGTTSKENIVHAKRNDLSRERRLWHHLKSNITHEEIVPGLRWELWLWHYLESDVVNPRTRLERQGSMALELAQPRRQFHA